MFRRLAEDVLGNGKAEKDSLGTSHGDGVIQSVAHPGESLTFALPLKN